MASRRPVGAMGNSMAAKRIRKEIADLTKENMGAIKLTPNESNIFQWRATLPGPIGSPYEGGNFDVDIRIPDDYPFSPPHLQFMTKVYHCNIAHTGAICLDLLKTAWSPALSLYKVVLSLSSLLTDPNPADPLVPSIAQEYKRNKKRHDDTAREWVKLYALSKAAAPSKITAPSVVLAAASSELSAPQIRRTISSGTPPVAARPSTGTPIQPPPVIGARRTHQELESSNVLTQSRRIPSSSTAGAAIDLRSEHSNESDVEVVEGASTDSVGEAARRVKRARTSYERAPPQGDISGDVIIIDD